MKSRFLGSFVAGLVLLGLVAGGAWAQAETKMVAFSEMGTGTVAPAAIKMPVSATVLRQVSAPLNDNGDTVMLNSYKANGAIFADILTSKTGQPWTLKNHIRLKTTFLRPQAMKVSMRWLQSDYRSGVLIILSDESESITLAFPKGFGALPYQQQWLTTNKGVRRIYDFSTSDSRGFAIVKATLDGSVGTSKPANDVQFYVWGGKMWVPRKPN